jgi:hypothetical protein
MALPNCRGGEALGQPGDDEIPFGFIHPPDGFRWSPRKQPQALDQTTITTIKQRKPGTSGTAFPVSHQHEWHRAGRSQAAATQLPISGQAAIPWPPTRPGATEIGPGRLPRP